MKHTVRLLIAALFVTLGVTPAFAALVFSLSA